MTTIRNLTFGFFILLSMPALSFAQAEHPDKLPASSGSTVTISISAPGVRFAALGGVKQMRVEVFNAGGDLIYNSDFQPGNVRDWKLRDKPEQRVPDGLYLCVVTVRDLSGRLSVKQGNVLVQGGQASLQLAEGQQAGQVEPEKKLDSVSGASTASLIVTAHDGREGQVTSTGGALTFRIGDFFSGMEREHMRITNEGRVGIGTDKPEATLDVAGTIRARDGIRFADGTVLTSAAPNALAPGVVSTSDANSPDGTANASVGGSGTTGKLLKWTDGAMGMAGDSTVTELNGNIGIGTATPGNLNGINFSTLGLHIKGSGQSKYIAVDDSTNVGLLLNDSSQTADNRMWAVFNQGSRFSVSSFTDAGNPTERMSVLRNGNVGIGTIAPTQKLDVVGNVKVSGDFVVAGNIAAKYQDFAEWVPARRPVAPGTVVSLDKTRTNGVMASTRAYDTHVAGVVSAQPGIILGEGGEGKVLVATMGRVKIKVDATRRPVKIGDLLVTSGKNGLAMKSLPIRVAGARIHRPGTIIGKALEPLAKGKGEILVLLSLQ